MSRFGGSHAVEIAAAPAACFELVCDTPRIPEWHRAVRSVEVLERDRNGRTALVRTGIDALVARVEVDLRVLYEDERSVRMHREAGDLRELAVTWTFERLPAGSTLASFTAEFDPGPVLSLLARGPVVAKLEALLAEQPPHGLKRALES